MQGTLPMTAEITDEELMRGVAEGRPEALGLLQARYGSLVSATAARALGRDAAEEMSQEVFLAVWRHAASFDPSRGTFRAWVFQITRSSVLNDLRRRGRRPRTTAPSNGSGGYQFPTRVPTPPSRPGVSIAAPSCERLWRPCLLPSARR